MGDPLQRVSVSHCANCNEMFSAALTGKESMLCRKCSMDCENAYAQMLKYIRQNKVEMFNYASVNKVGKTLNIPPAFVQALYQEGRFNDFLHQFKCKRCNRDYEARSKGKGICSDCSDVLVKQIERSFQESNGSDGQRDLSEAKPHVVAKEGKFRLKKGKRVENRLKGFTCKKCEIPYEARFKGKGLCFDCTRELSSEIQKSLQINKQEEVEQNIPEPVVQTFTPEELQKSFDKLQKEFDQKLKSPINQDANPDFQRPSSIANKKHRYGLKRD